MQRHPKLYFQDILESIKALETYTQGMSFDAFIKNALVRDAVIKNFLIIGEAVKNVPDPIKRKNPDVAWKQIAGFRDVLIHAYFGTNMQLVWDAVKEDLPQFKKKILKINKQIV